ncbi:MAG: hypothetical protein U1E38_00810 [Rhodospirillales bacterium]
MDMLTAGARADLVPFADAGESRKRFGQGARGARTGGDGGPGGLSAEILAGAIDQALTLPVASVDINNGNSNDGGVRPGLRQSGKRRPRVGAGDWSDLADELDDNAGKGGVRSGWRDDDATPRLPALRSSSSFPRGTIRRWRWR